MQAFVVQKSIFVEADSISVYQIHRKLSVTGFRNNLEMCQLKIGAPKESPESLSLKSLSL